MSNRLADADMQPTERRIWRNNRYSYESRLAAGSFATVYIAREQSLNKKVVVKHFHVDDRTGAQREDFAKEGRILVTLGEQTQHLVQALDFFVEGGPPHDTLLEYFLVLEYVPDGDLQKLISEKKDTLDIGLVLKIARQLANALSAIHAANIVHCDLKPGNVLLRWPRGEDPVAKVADFGIMMDLKRSSEPVHGRSVGFAPREQYAPQRGDKVDHRTDIFSYGALVYYLLTGRSPWDWETRTEYMEVLLEKKPPTRASERRREVKAYPGLDELLLQLLEHNKEDRPDSIGFVLEELDLVNERRRWVREWPGYLAEADQLMEAHKDFIARAQTSAENLEIDLATKLLDEARPVWAELASYHERAGRVAPFMASAAGSSATEFLVRFGAIDKWVSERRMPDRTLDVESALPLFAKLAKARQATVDGQWSEARRLISEVSEGPEAVILSAPFSRVQDELNTAVRAAVIPAKEVAAKLAEVRAALEEKKDFAAYRLWLDLWVDAGTSRLLEEAEAALDAVGLPAEPGLAKARTSLREFEKNFATPPPDPELAALGKTLPQVRKALHRHRESRRQANQCASELQIDEARKHLAEATASRELLERCRPKLESWVRHPWLSEPAELPLVNSALSEVDDILRDGRPIEPADQLDDLAGISDARKAIESGDWRSARKLIDDAAGKTGLIETWHSQVLNELHGSVCRSIAPFVESAEAILRIQAKLAVEGAYEVYPLWRDLPLHSRAKNAFLAASQALRDAGSPDVPTLTGAAAVIDQLEQQFATPPKSPEQERMEAAVPAIRRQLAECQRCFVDAGEAALAFAAKDAEAAAAKGEAVRESLRKPLDDVNQWVASSWAQSSPHVETLRELQDELVRAIDFPHEVEEPGFLAAIQKLAESAGAITRGEWANARDLIEEVRGSSPLLTRCRDKLSSNLHWRAVRSVAPATEAAEKICAAARALQEKKPEAAAAAIAGVPAEMRSPSKLRAAADTLSSAGVPVPDELIRAIAEVSRIEEALGKAPADKPEPAVSSGLSRPAPPKPNNPRREKPKPTESRSAAPTPTHPPVTTRPQALVKNTPPRSPLRQPALLIVAGLILTIGGLGTWMYLNRTPDAPPQQTSVPGEEKAKETAKEKEEATAKAKKKLDAGEEKKPVPNPELAAAEERKKQSAAALAKAQSGYYEDAFRILNSLPARDAVRIGTYSQVIDMLARRAESLPPAQGFALLGRAPASHPRIQAARARLVQAVIDQASKPASTGDYDAAVALLAAAPQDSPKIRDAHRAYSDQIAALKRGQDLAASGNYKESLKVLAATPINDAPADKVRESVKGAYLTKLKQNVQSKLSVGQIAQAEGELKDARALIGETPGLAALDKEVRDARVGEGTRKAK